MIGRWTQPLYHYTNLEGFMGIVSSGCFWASDTLHMNDRNEVETGKQLIRNAIHKAAAIGTINGQQQQLLLEQLLSNRHAPLYILSFCAESDLLSMWRNYGGGTGLCIELSHGFSFELKDQHTSGLVDYKPTDQERSIDLELTYAINKLPNPATQAWISQNYSTETDYVLWKLLTAASYCKHQSFREEQEIRYVFQLDNKSVYFRPSRYGIASYLKISCNHDVLPIKSVVIGPHPEAAAMQLGVENFLARRGYGGVPVSLSRTPFRH